MKQFEKKVYLAVVTVLSCVMLLTGCGQKETETSKIGDLSNVAATIPDRIEVLHDDPVESYASASGLYRTIKREKDGSKNISYIDFASGQEIVLCSQLNCRHDSDACTSWTPVSQGQLRPIPVGNKLVLLHGGNPKFAEILGDASRARVEIMNLDGTDRHEIHAFEATDMVPTLPRAGLARSADTLYFAIESSLAGNRTIYAVNIASEQVEPIYVMEGEEERIIGGTQDALILEYTPGAYDMSNDPKDLVTQVVKLDLGTKETTALFTHPFQSVGTCANGSYLSLQQDQQLHIYDLETGAETAVRPVVLDEAFHWEYMQCSGVFDSYLLINASADDRYFISYQIDTETGEANELNWTYEDYTGYPTASSIAAEYEDQFLVVTGEERKEVVMPTLEGKKMKTGSTVLQYGLISKEEFWNNTGEVIPITDAKK